MKKNRKAQKSTTKTSTVSKLTVVRGKTSRATIINLLIAQKGKTVPMATLKSAVQKVTGLQPETVESRLKTRVKLIAAWAKSHNFKFNATSKGMSLIPVKG